MKVTDEQLREVGEALGWAKPYALEHGKKAFEMCAPIALQEPTLDEKISAKYADNEGCDVGDIITSLLQSRLRSFTDPETDPAVEAVNQVLVKRFPRGVAAVCTEEIVAIVRACDKERK